MLVADGGRLQEIVGVFFRLGLSDVLLDVFVEPDCLVEVDGLQVIEIDVVEDLLQLVLVFLAELVEGLLFGDEGAAEKSSIRGRLHSGVEGVFAGLIALVIFDRVVCALHEEEQDDFKVGFLAGEVEGRVSFAVAEIFSALEVVIVMGEHPENFVLVVEGGDMGGGVECYGWEVGYFIFPCN